MNRHYYLERILSERNVTLYHWTIRPAQFSSSTSLTIINYLFLFISLCCWFSVALAIRSTSDQNTRRLLVLRVLYRCDIFINKWQTEMMNTEWEQKTQSISNSIFFFLFVSTTKDTRHQKYAESISFFWVFAKKTNSIVQYCGSFRYEFGAIARYCFVPVASTVRQQQRRWSLATRIRTSSASKKSIDNLKWTSFRAEVVVVFREKTTTKSSP